MVCFARWLRQCLDLRRSGSYGERWGCTWGNMIVWMQIKSEIRTSRNRLCIKHVCEKRSTCQCLKCFHRTRFFLKSYFSQRTFCNSLGCLLELFWIGLVSSFWVALDGVITKWSCLISELVRAHQTPQLFNFLPYQAWEVDSFHSLKLLGDQAMVSFANLYCMGTLFLSHAFTRSHSSRTVASSTLLMRACIKLLL